LPANCSHYNSERTNKLYFEDCTLNNTKLYSRFIDFMATEKQQIIDLKFVTFYNYFNKNFNYGFSNPKTDMRFMFSSNIRSCKSWVHFKGRIWDAFRKS
jgi:hypothetical protein